MTDNTHSGLAALLEGAVKRGDTHARDELSEMTAADDVVGDRAHETLLAQLLSRTLTGPQVRRGAETLADLEVVRRSRISRQLTEHRTRFEGIRTLTAAIRSTSRAERPVAVTTRVCRDLGFGKSMYSLVEGKAWAPATIAINPDLGGGFDELRRAVNGYVIPRGAAPREEAIVQNRKSVAVDYADTFRDTYQPLVQLSQPHGYIGVPIVAAGRVRAILHADRHDVEVKATDLGLLHSVAQMCALMEEKESIRALIAARNRTIRDEMIALNTALNELEQTEITFTEVQSDADHPSVYDGGGESLSPREYEVFELVASGIATVDIARRLAVSEETVKSHLQRLYRKLGVTSRSEAAATYRKGVVPVRALRDRR